MPGINKQGIEAKLLELGFERVSNTINGCFVNRVSNVSCYRSYDDKIKSHFVMAKGEQRLNATTIDEIELTYYKIRL